MTGVYRGKTLENKDEKEVFNILRYFDRAPNLDRKGKLLFEKCKRNFKPILAEKISNNIDEIDKIELNIQDISDIKSSKEMSNFINESMKVLNEKYKDVVINETINDNEPCKQLMNYYKKSNQRTIKREKHGKRKEK